MDNKNSFLTIIASHDPYVDDVADEIIYLDGLK